VIVAPLAEAALRELDADGGAIDLLIALDGSVLAFPGVLARCQQLLLAPFDDEALRGQIDAMFTATDDDPLAAELLERNLIGQSGAMRALRRRIRSVAGYLAPVAICGETGTGKELVARSLHYLSPRKNSAFVPINCAALNDELLLAELFGHERGAFTDARHARRGLVAQADGGTLFLDEVDSLSPRAQGALLRFLQDREYRPVGGERLLHADVRVVCATNRNFRGCVQDGQFREDLYYRLNVVELQVPPLRERHGDIELLSDHLLRQFGQRYSESHKRLHPLTLQWMGKYQWPGNVRELENHLHRCHVMCVGPLICVPNVQADPVAVHGGDLSAGAGLLAFQLEKERAVVRFERDYLCRVLEIAGGNVSQAARCAGKERRAFTRLLQKHRIDTQAFRASSQARR
jgi:DNA-binding NtrC family response regulator